MPLRDSIMFFVKFGVVGIYGIVLLMLGQIGQAIQSNSDLRLHVISTWTGNDPARKDIADKFLTTCLGAYVPVNFIGFTPVTLRACGSAIGASELVAEIELSDKILRTYAWPLSVFDKYGRD